MVEKVYYKVDFFYFIMSSKVLLFEPFQKPYQTPTLCVKGNPQYYIFYYEKAI